MVTLFWCDIVAGRGQHLCKTANDVQGRTHLVTDILNEVRLHLLSFDDMLIGRLHLAPMTAATLDDIYQGSDEE